MVLPLWRHSDLVVRVLHLKNWWSVAQSDSVEKELTIDLSDLFYTYAVCFIVFFVVVVVVLFFYRKCFPVTLLCLLVSST